MKRVILLGFGGFVLLGCGEKRSPVAENRPAEPALPAPPPTGPAEPPPASAGPVAVPVLPKKPEEAPTLPEDTGGHAVQKALKASPARSAELPGTMAPLPRQSDYDRGELPNPPVAWKMPNWGGGLPPVKPAKPSPPPERPPADLGQSASANLHGFQFAEKPLARADSPANPGATDLPILSRPVFERPSIDDPTADITTNRVIDTPFPTPSAPLPFLKVTIPDPFEFAEQLKGKLPRGTEFATQPSAVNPERK